MDTIITIKDVSFNYVTGEQISRGVKNVNLEIERGSFVVLLGHNGSGKSTLAKLLNGFLTPTEGEIIVDGINTADESKIFDLRSRVGMVFQNPDNQMVASIIEDDLAFGPENLGVEREEIGRRINWALDIVNMSEHRHRTPTKLSGGQKQRIAIAAVLAMLPNILILDESTAMLDPKGRSEVLETAHKLNKEENMTVILITHYMDEAIDADGIVVMNDGEVILDGAPSEVYQQTDVIRRAGLELPVAARVSEKLIERGYPIKFCLTDKELAEELCQLK